MKPNNEKYVVYENDLKFKSMRNIDPNKAEWYDESVKNMFDKDFDTISARLKKSKDGDFIYLDLSRLNLEKIPKFTGYAHYDKLVKIKYLFINDNNLSECGDRLSCFENLEVLDISFNKISEISFLPKTLQELICHNNKLTQLQSHNTIKILDCMNNPIEKIGNYPKLVDLICIENKLTNLPTYPNVERIICKQNPLNDIEYQPNLKQLDCSETNLSGRLENYPNLIGLICNHTKISYVGNLDKLESLEIVGCRMKVSYIQTLKCLLCENLESDIQLSTKFKIKSVISEGNSICCLFNNL